MDRVDPGSPGSIYNCFMGIRRYTPRHLDRLGVQGQLMQIGVPLDRFHREELYRVCISRAEEELYKNGLETYLGSSDAYRYSVRITVWVTDANEDFLFCGDRHRSVFLFDGKLRTWDKRKQRVWLEEHGIAGNVGLRLTILDSRVVAARGRVEITSELLSQLRENGLVHCSWQMLRSIVCDCWRTGLSQYTAKHEDYGVAFEAGGRMVVPITPCIKRVLHRDETSCRRKNLLNGMGVCFQYNKAIGLEEIPQW